MGLKALYLFVNPTAESAKHKATLELPTSTIFVVGVRSLDEGAQVARRYVEEEGVAIVELCGGFGYEGATKVSSVVADKAAVGLVVHQVWNAPKLAAVLAGR